MQKIINNYLKNTLKVLLCILLAVFPLGVIINIEIINSVRVYPIDIILGLISINLVMLIINNKLDIKNFPFFKELSLFIGIAFIALLANFHNLTIQGFFISLSYLVRIIVYSSLIFAVPLLDKQTKHKYLYLLSFSGLIFAIFGLIQYVLYPDLRNLYYLDWDSK